MMDRMMGGAMPQAGMPPEAAEEKAQASPSRR